MNKKLIAKLQNLGQHAARIRQAVEAAPAQAAQLREAVVLTTGQLHQLRAEVQTGISDLRADTGDHLLASLTEIEAGRDTLRQAGFTLEGVDLELGATASQRLLLQLQKIESVPARELKSLLAAHQSRPALRGVLAALLRAAELADRVDLPGLSYQQLTVYVGPAPTVRIGWRPEAWAEPVAEAPAVAAGLPPLLGGSQWSATSAVSSFAPALVSPPAPAAAPASSTPKPSPALAPTAVSTAPTTPYPAPPTTQATAATPAVALSQAPAALDKDWRKGALDRFKKMPDLTRDS